MSRRSPVCRWKNFRRYSGRGADVCAGATRLLANRPSRMLLNALNTFYQRITYCESCARLLLRYATTGTAQRIAEFVQLLGMGLAATCGDVEDVDGFMG